MTGTMDTSGGAWSGLDAALHELGMLSAVTESRKEYLHEQLEKLRRQQSIVPLESSNQVKYDKFMNRHLQGEQMPSADGVSNKKPDNNVGCECLSSSDVENNENSCVNAEGRIETTISGSKLNCSSDRDNSVGGGFNVLQMNTQYITGVSLGATNDMKHKRNCCFMQVTRYSNTTTYRRHHLKPYEIPWHKEERVRTKSENAEGEFEEYTSKLSVASEFSTPDSEFYKIQKPNNVSLYKSRSLESVPVSVTEDETLPSSQELDSVSRGMQYLYVNE